MTKYYFEVPVVPIQPGFQGWVWCEWPNGKRWKHWGFQLTDKG